MNVGGCPIPCPYEMRYDHDPPVPPAAQRLRERRIALRLTYEQVTTKSGVPPSVLNMVEHAAGFPNRYEWSRLITTYKLLEEQREKEGNER